MPHIIVEGPITAEGIWLAFRPLEIREGTNVYKAESAYLAETKDHVLIRSMTVERGFGKRFFVKIDEKVNGLHFGLEGLGLPERSDGVKRLLALFALQVLESVPEAKLGATDLAEYLKEPSA